jgi:hypothetical protein
MSVLELKGRLLNLVFQIEDEKLLNDLYDDMTAKLKTVGSPSFDWWDELSPQQQVELKEAVKESEDVSNLVSHEDALKTLSKWRR